MVDSLLDAVKNAIYADATTPQTPGNDPSGLIAEIENLFRRYAVDQTGSQAYESGGPIGEMPRLHATEDPYGDTAPTFGSLR